MNVLPRSFFLSVTSVLILVGCQRPPTQEEITARASAMLAEQEKVSAKAAKLFAERMAAERTEAENSKIAQTAAAVDAIVIPQVKLENVSLQSVIEHLSQRAWQLQPSNAVNLILEMPPSTMPSFGSVSIDRTNATLRALLEEACQQAGAELEIQPYCVLVCPPTTNQSSTAPAVP
jgi:hypothetical protein